MPTRRLHCPRCHGEFDYDFLPGMSATSLRLGSSRYMRCPLCRQFGVFSLRSPEGEDRRATPGPPPLPTSCTVPRFNDRRAFLRFGGVVAVPSAVLILSGVLGVVLGLPTTVDIVLIAAGAVLLCVGAIVTIGFFLPDRVR